ncbi:MAG: chemotaxis protein CheW [Proteobacteria bacterium]|nr:chemotaxis protein CheW [Pseudomonadota bacterium]
MESFVIFESAGKYFGIETRYIYRIADDVKTTPVPLVPSCHAGLIYYRGDLFDIIDFGRLMGKQKTAPSVNPYIVLLKWDQRKLGLIPDRIVGMEYREDNNGSHTIFTKDEHGVQLITPGEIWKTLWEFTNGS